MRAGGFTIQQALSSDAATIIKQAVTLARRRGHAQVTPLHVANTMLSSTTGLLRSACLRSQSSSHPLQCKALELCFNVALNRLPTSSSSSPMMLGPNHASQHPSISNALVAAFKRAQAHQRRGSVENQQQPLLAVKIELQQLIISILDDPSVSRVMREAGFSSTQVKTNIEQVIVSLELSSHDHQTSTPPSILSNTKQNNGDNRRIYDNQLKVRNEDVMCVIDSLLNDKKRSRRSLVVVGECVATIEGVVKGVMEKVDKGQVDETLKDVKFINLPLFSFSQLSRVEVEQKLGELMNLVKSFILQRGVVLYLGDLKWISEYRVNSSWSNNGRGYYYCPIEHLIMELGRLICSTNEEINSKFWVMGISSFQTYMKCRNGNPSLEIIWKLHPLTIPAGSLSLSLVPQRDFGSECGSKNDNNGDSRGMLESRDDKQLTCCMDCSMNFESEAKSSRSSSLPSWLAPEKIVVNNEDKECVSIKELCKKWNSICTSVHKNKSMFQRSLSFSSVSPSSSPASCFSYNQENPDLNRASNDCQLWNFRGLEESYERKDRHEGFPSNPSSTPNSVSSSDLMEVEYVQRFKEFNGENLKILCNALEEKVVLCHKDIVVDIVSTVLQCRSGMIRRKEKLDINDEPKEETWFLFQGIDSQPSKEKIARELAKVIFGSYLNFTTISLSNFSSSPRVDSLVDESSRNSERSREEESRFSYLERFTEAMSMNPHRVFLVEDVEQVDYCSQMGIKRAIESGKVTRSNGEQVGLCDAIIVLSCESSLTSKSRTCSPPVSKEKAQEEDEEEDEDGKTFVSLDLNISLDEVQSMSMNDDIGLVESVDKCINFNIQDLSL